MKLSEKWLRSRINPVCSIAELAEKMTMAGIEIEGLQAVAPPFTGVIVAEVLHTEQHPNADRLRICQVLIAPNAEPVKIVCGAANVRAGLKVALATIGAKLPGNFDIKKSKIRGEESNGMLCSAKELGLTEDLMGLWNCLKMHLWVQILDNIGSLTIPYLKLI